MKIPKEKVNGESCQAPYGQQAILVKYENLITKERRKDVNVEDLHIDVYR